MFSQPRGGGVKGGRYELAPKETPLANLHLALARRVGVEVERFADSTGELELA